VLSELRAPRARGPIAIASSLRITTTSHHALLLLFWRKRNACIVDRCLVGDWSCILPSFVCDAKTARIYRV